MRYGITPEQIRAMNDGNDPENDSDVDDTGARDYSSPENVAYADQTSRQNLVDAGTRFASMAAADKAEMAQKQFHYNRNGIAMNDAGEFHVRGDNKYTYRYDGNDFYTNGHKINLEEVRKRNPHWEGFTLMKGNEKEQPSNGAPNTAAQHQSQSERDAAALQMVSPHIQAEMEARAQRRGTTEEGLDSNVIGPDALLGGLFAKGGAKALGFMTDAFASPAEQMLHRQGLKIGAKTVGAVSDALSGKVGSYAADAMAAARNSGARQLAQGVERGMPQFSDEATQIAQQYLESGGGTKALGAAGRFSRGVSSDMFEDPHVANAVKARMAEIARHPALLGQRLSPQKLLQMAIGSMK